MTMDADLSVGSYELLDAVCREAKGDPAALVLEEDVVARVGWSAGEVRSGLEHLVRASALRWAGTADPACRFLCVSAYGLELRHGSR